MGKAHQTAARPLARESRKATGSRTISWRTTDTSRLRTPCPSAWNTEEHTMEYPANRKLREMIRRAGMPMVSRSPESFSDRNRSSRIWGASWKASRPANMIVTAAATLSLMVWTIRSGRPAP